METFIHYLNVLFPVMMLGAFAGIVRNLASGSYTWKSIYAEAAVAALAGIAVHFATDGMDMRESYRALCVLFGGYSSRTLIPFFNNQVLARIGLRDKPPVAALLLALTAAALVAGCSTTDNIQSVPVSHRYYSLLPDRPDPNEAIWQLPTDAKVGLPSRVDLRPLCPPVYDQGQLGSCGLNAYAGAYDLVRKQSGLPYIYLSRLFAYYQVREIEGTLDEDSGVRLQDVIKAGRRIGVCTETTWPYDIAQFKAKPPSVAYEEAANYTLITAAKIPGNNLRLIKLTLANHYPIIYGVVVYPSFESQEVARTGIIPMPPAGEQPLGGHATVLVGYDEQANMFLGRNSWGSGWGIGGYYWIPAAYIANPLYARDFWVIKKVR